MPDHDQMDTNGFTGHAQLREVAENRLWKMTMLYCNHVTEGHHVHCGTNCPIHQGLIDAYNLFIST